MDDFFNRLNQLPGRKIIMVYGPDHTETFDVYPSADKWIIVNKPRLLDLLQLDFIVVTVRSFSDEKTMIKKPKKRGKVQVPVKQIRAIIFNKNSMILPTDDETKCWHRVNFYGTAFRP